MKNIAVAALLALVIAGLAFADSSKARPSGLSDADALGQLERDWADASEAIDANRCSQIIADDWRLVGPNGVKTKETAIQAMQTRDYKLESTDFGSMDIRVFGGIGVVQGTTTVHLLEKNGQHTIYKWAWMDVLEKRADKWVVVRTQTTKLQ